MKSLLHIGLFLMSVWTAAAQDKVQVVTTVTGPREIAVQINDLNALVSRTLVRVTNLTDQPLTVVIEGRLDGPELMVRTVRSSLTAAHYIQLAPRATEIFTGDRIRNTFGTHNIEIWKDGRIVPIEYFYSYRDGSGRLPEGTYNFCFDAYEVDPRVGRPVFAQPVNVQTGQCVSVYARVYDPPLLQTINDVGGIYTVPGPFDVTATPDGSLRLQWQAPAGLPAGTSLTYQVLMAELIPGDTRDPNQVIQAIDIPSEPLAFYRQKVADAARVVTHQVMPVGFASPMQPGYTYALQITAESNDPLNPLPIQNSGRSPVYSFVWGGRSSGAAIQLNAYPASGTYMPFRGMPLIVKYGPYSDTYNLFESATRITNTFGEATSFNRRLPWRPNPLEAQRRATGDPTLDQARAQHIAVTQSAAEYDYGYYSYIRRGGRYNWSSEVTIQDGSRPVVQTVDGHFFAGMDAPVLRHPENRSVQDTGLIKFEFKTANEPALQTLSPFDIVQASRRSGTGSFDVSILETGILEVARSERFDSILHHHEFKLDRTFLSSTTDHEQVSWADVVREVYRDELAEFRFTDTGTYYWRVRWLADPRGAWDSPDYNKSETWQFSIKADSTASTPDSTTAPPPGADCGTPCELTYTYVGGAPSPISVNIGETVHIGQFTMEITEITSRSGEGNTTYTGKGVVTNFGFIVNRVLVEFTNIRIANSTTGKRVYDGRVKATGGGRLASNIFHLAGASSVGPEGLATIGSGDPTLAVPFGWDQSIDGHKIIATIDSIAFNPTQARAKFRLGYEMPGEFAGHPVVFGAEICIAPGGFREDFDIYLERDLVIGDTVDHEYALLLKGRTRVDSDGGPSDLEEITRLSWDCHGFKSLKLAMEVKFPRENILPENELTGQVEETGRVSGFMTLMLDRARREAGDQWGFIGTVSFPKSFQFSFWPGWGFKVENAIFDFSDSKNDTEMRFPAGYDVSLLGAEGATVDDRLRNTWQGFYLKTIRVSAPRTLTEGEEDGEPRKAFYVSDLLIDKTGLTGYVGALNVAEASDKGWRISLDTVQVGIVQTRSVTGRLAGSLGAPFFEEDSRLDYSSMLAIGFDGKVEYNFQINVPANRPLNMKMWQASMKLQSSSYLRFSVSNQRSTAARFQGLFNGEIGLDSSRINNIPGLSMSGIKFENFGFDTDNPNFFTFSRVNRSESGGQMVFSFASPQHTAGDFPLNIRDISLSMASEGGHLLPKLGFVTELSLSDLGFKASLGMNIIGEMQLSPFSFGIRGAEVTEIGIDCDFNGFKLGGMLAFYQDDATYGNGVHGRISATLPMGIEGRLEARFGTMGNAANPSSFYDYWYVDGLIKINPGITIFSGFAIYGFGGGAYYHMTMNRAPAADAAQATQDAPSATGDGPGQSSGTTYTPDRNTGLGFMATVLLGTQPKEDVFNMDVTLRAQFSTSGGLQLIEFEGNGYVMNQMTERSDSPPVRAQVRFGYYNLEGREYVQGNFDVFLNVYNLIVGAGAGDKLVSAELYADLNGSNGGQWWFYMGKDRPIDQRCGLLIKIPGLSLDARSYIMVGHGIPADLPPLPDAIREILYGGTSQLENQVAGDNRRIRSNASMQNGQGFAFGAHFSTGMDFNFLMFYASLGIHLGFDVNISQNDSRVCAESGLQPGIDGWYAQGQAYAALTGELGIQIDLFFIKGKFKILELAAAVAMQAKLPNPNYFQGRAALYYAVLGGRISGRCNFNMEFGEKCTVVSNDPLQGLQFISDIKTSDDGTPVSVFSEVLTAFNFAMNEVLELEEESGGDMVIRRFRPYVSGYRLMKGDGAAVAGTSWELRDNGYVAVLRRNEALDPVTAHRAAITVRAKELLPGGREIDVRRDGRVASEDRDLPFTTGERPAHLVEENVLRTYPVRRQQHYLQDEVKNTALGSMAGKGYLKIRLQDYLFAAETPVVPAGGVVTVPAYNHHFLARFTPRGGGRATEVQLTYNAGQDLITFDMPVLTNAKTYDVQLLKRSVPNPVYAALSQTATLPYRVIQQIERRVVGTIRITELDEEGQSVINTYRSEAEIENRRFGRTSSSTPNQETILYQFLFRTSRYNSFKDKMAGAQLGGARYTLGIKTAEGTITEGFDVEEAPQSTTVQSLVRLAHDTAPDGSFIEMNPQLRTINQFYRDFEGQRGLVTKTITLPRLPGIAGISYRTGIRNPNTYVTLVVNRNQTATVLARLMPQRQTPPVGTLLMNGNFVPLLPNTPPPDETGSPLMTAGTVVAAGVTVGYPATVSGPVITLPPSATQSGFRFTVNDVFDWNASADFSRLKGRLNGFAAASVFTVSDITTLLNVPITLDALDATRRNRLRALGNTAYPLPQSGYRYRINFIYQVPTPSGSWIKTSAVPQHFTIN